MSKKEELLSKLDHKKLPQHIAIIMDGNGRWAKKRNLPRSAGHLAGVKTVRRIVETSSNIGIKFLTMYAFSTENWKRTKNEVSTIMSLFKIYLKKEISTFNKNDVRLNVIGNTGELSDDIQKALDDALKKTSVNKGLTFTLAINYGSRQEITNAVKNIVNDVEKGIITRYINENIITKYLYTSDLPDPDLLIRTSGEMRISNFLLWQLSYAEIWVTDTYWPDFEQTEYIKAILDYQNRQRRFGKHNG
ncbi:MAG: isoprenyl transferase [bacterium]|nr:isoprenyl transferase [bacterium]